MNPTLSQYECKRAYCNAATPELKQEAVCNTLSLYASMCIAKQVYFKWRTKSFCRKYTIIFRQDEKFDDLENAIIIVAVSYC